MIAASEAERRSVSRPLPEMDADAVWLSLVVQICAIGGARRAYALLDSPAATTLSPPRLVAMKLATAHRVVHAVLRAAGIRYVGADPTGGKVGAIIAWLEHPAMVRDGRCVFARTVGGLRTIHASDVGLREALVEQRIPYLGRKSLSDWLANRGVAEDVLAIDLRVARALAQHLDVDVSSESVASRRRYLAWEAACRLRLADPLGVSLAEVDKRLFVIGLER